MSADALSWQGSLFGLGEPTFDRAFTTTARHELASGAWIDHQPEWLSASDEVFDRVLRVAGWGQARMQMYGERVLQPRLTAHWAIDETPQDLSLLREIGEALSARYRLSFTRVGCNLYRHGDDSVAWHGDRIARERPSATIAIVSLGHRRPFRLRPRDGGESLGFDLGRGDLLVMGGSCQRTWQHTVPKVRRPVGPRISVTYRHEYA